MAASPVPHAEILEFIRPQLKAQGVDLQVKVFSDYVQPNLAVSDKQLEALGPIDNNTSEGCNV